MVMPTLLFYENHTISFVVVVVMVFFYFAVQT